MTPFTSISEIDTTTREGRYLMATLAQLSLAPDFSDKEPDTIISMMGTVVAMMYGSDEERRAASDVWKAAFKTRALTEKISEILNGPDTPGIKAWRESQQPKAPGNDNIFQPGGWNNRCVTDPLTGLNHPNKYQPEPDENGYTTAGLQPRAEDIQALRDSQAKESREQSAGRLANCIQGAIDAYRELQSKEHLLSLNQKHCINPSELELRIYAPGEDMKYAANISLRNQPRSEREANGLDGRNEKPEAPGFGATDFSFSKKNSGNE